MDKYVFDTSALICYIENEDGSDTLEEIMIEALEKSSLILVSIVTVIELYYISKMEQGEKMADDRMELLKTLPFKIVNIQWADIKTIGTLKATASISFADSCIASVVLQSGGILVHKDPEFENLQGVQQLKLPYKKKTRK